MIMIRAAIAASSPCAGPIETLSTVIITNSLTPAPPGNNDAKPITIAKLMAAVAVAYNSGVDGNGAELGIAEINMKNSVYSTPIVANGVLYISNKTHLFAIAND